MEPASRWKFLLRALAGLTLLAYPVIVWQGLRAGSPRRIALVLLCVVAPAAFLRMRSSARARVQGMAFLPLLTVACLAIASALDHAGFILAVPVLINTLFLFSFGATLRRGSLPMVERFALLQEESLSDAQREWCLLWTRIWCVFFFLNGTTALLLALLAPLSWWAFYTGLVSYGFMGTLFVGEWFLRRRRFKVSTHDGADEGQ